MRNTAMVIIGIVLIAGGAFVIANKGIPYTSRDVVLNVGNVSATAEVEKTRPVPMLVTGLVMAGGVLLVILGARKTG
jgi:hypothetical protein